MIWMQFLAPALVIVSAGVRLARYWDVLGEKTGLGRGRISGLALARSAGLPELFTGFGATGLATRVSDRTRGPLGATAGLLP